MCLAVVGERGLEVCHAPLPLRHTRHILLQAQVCLGMLKVLNHLDYLHMDTEENTRTKLIVDYQRVHGETN